MQTACMERAGPVALPADEGFAAAAAAPSCSVLYSLVSKLVTACTPQSRGEHQTRCRLLAPTLGDYMLAGRTRLPRCWMAATSYARAASSSLCSTTVSLMHQEGLYTGMHMALKRQHWSYKYACHCASRVVSPKHDTLRTHLWARLSKVPRYRYLLPRTRPMRASQRPAW